MSKVVIAREASSTLTPRILRSSIWSSYAPPEESDLAKIVGLEVTPTTCRSSISICRLPVRSRSRLMSSSHTDTPASDSCPRTSTDTVGFPSLRAAGRTQECLGPDPGQTVACGSGYPLRCDAKLLIELLIRRRSAEVVYSD